MADTQKSQAGSEQTSNTQESVEQISTSGDTVHGTGSDPFVFSRASLESTATTLPPYREQPDRPSRYDSASVPTAGPHIDPKLQSRPQASSAGVSAAAVSAVMATSSSENDKMHSKRSQKVDDWNKDFTYKGKLSRMTGSSGKWNYFGADVGGNPFKGFGKKK